MKKTWLFLGLVLLLQFALHLPFLGEPLSQDEATYAQIGARIAHGELLYRDVVDVKPPGLFLIAQLLGRNVRLIRLETALYSLLLTILVFAIGRQAAGDALGLAAALLFAVFSGGVFVEGTMVTAELYMLLPLLLALASFLAGWLFWAGIFSGLALLIKQPAAFNLLALGVALLLAGWRDRASWRKLGLLMAGSLVFPLLTLAYFWSRGALADFINANFFYSLGMVKPNLPNFLVKTFLMMLFENSVLWALALAGAWLIWKKFRTERTALLLIWGAFSLLGVYAAGFSLGRYYLHLIPGLCLLGGVVIANWRTTGWPRSTSRPFLLLLAVLSFFIIISEYDFYLTYNPDQISAQRYGAGYNSAARDIGLKIRARTGPGDRVYGLASAVFYSGRPSPAKYYLTVRGGRTEIKFLGRLIYAHDFNVRRGPALERLVDEDIYRALADKRTRYFVVYLKDYYAPPDIWRKAEEYGYVLDGELSDKQNSIIVMKRR